MRLLVLALITFLLAGCATDLPRSEQIGLGRRSIMVSASHPESYRLTDAYTYVFKSGGLLGDMEHSLLPGTYVEWGKDRDGTFYRHAEGRGVLRSGNLGIKEDGGFYVPDKEEGRWGIWIVPKDSVFAIPAGGSIVSIYSPASAGDVFYCVHVPQEDESTLKTKLERIPAEQARPDNAG